METGRDFLEAIRKSTDAAWEEHGPGAAEFIEKLITFVHARCDAMGLTGRRRTAIIYLEGMLRATQIRWRTRAQDLQKIGNALGVDVETGSPKGQKVS